MNLNKFDIVGLVLTAVAVGCLIPGITEPMLVIKLHALVDAGMAKANFAVLDKEASILQTVAELFDNGQILVATLIFLFSIVVPILKAVLIVGARFISNGDLAGRIDRFVQLIGKWSMADVFVVGVFLAYLSTQSKPVVNVSSIAFMGFSVDLETKVVLSSTLGIGFYYFVGYCLVSLVGLTCLQVGSK